MNNQLQSMIFKMQSSFQKMSDKLMSHLFCFYITALSAWLGKLVSLSWPIISKTVTNHDFLAYIFPQEVVTERGGGGYRACIFVTGNLP